MNGGYKSFFASNTTAKNLQFWNDIALSLSVNIGCSHCEIPSNWQTCQTYIFSVTQKFWKFQTAYIGEKGQIGFQSDKSEIVK